MSLLEKFQDALDIARFSPFMREWAERLEDVLAAGSRYLIVPIAYTDATGNPTDAAGVAAAFPAGSLVVRAHIVPTTLWDALTSFSSGLLGSVSAFITDAEHDLTGGVGAINEARTVEVGVYLAAATTVLHTWVQGAAATGAGYIFYEYVPRGEI